MLFKLVLSLIFLIWSVMYMLHITNYQRVLATCIGFSKKIIDEREMISPIFRIVKNNRLIYSDTYFDPKEKEVWKQNKSYKIWLIPKSKSWYCTGYMRIFFLVFPEKNNDSEMYHSGFGDVLLEALTAATLLLVGLTGIFFCLFGLAG